MNHKNKNKNKKLFFNQLDQLIVWYNLLNTIIIIMITKTDMVLKFLVKLCQSWYFFHKWKISKCLDSISLSIAVNKGLKMINVAIVNYSVYKLVKIYTNERFSKHFIQSPNTLKNISLFDQQSFYIL